ncbi:response regulator [Bifidobacterium aerophilum]|nr:response regulator transcription factor [Bifidobacterium aerophilum]
MAESTTNKSPITIAIVDNDLITLKTLQSLINQTTNIHVTWISQSGRSALTQCLEDDNSPDVLLLDMGLSDIPGTQVCRRIRRNSSEPKILAITSYPIELYAADIADSGAQGIIEKNDYLNLYYAIRQIKENNIISPVSFRNYFETSKTAHQRLEMTPKDGFESLTYTEIQVLNMLSGGIDPKNIAKQLSITPTTVRTHMMHIRFKLKSFTTAQALVKWTREYNGGLVCMK